MDSVANTAAPTVTELRALAVLSLFTRQLVSEKDVQLGKQFVLSRHGW